MTATVDSSTKGCPPDVAVLDPEEGGREKARSSASPRKAPPDAAAFFLKIACESLNDIESNRIALGNRVRAMRDDLGLGDTPECQRLVALYDALFAVERDCELEVKRAVRMHPLGPFIRRTVGIGEKQGGRLLGAVGDVLIKSAIVDRDTGVVLEPARLRRGPAELWAYCGLHTVPGGNQSRHGAQMTTVPAGDQCASDAHMSRVPGGNQSASEAQTPVVPAGDHLRPDTHTTNVPGGNHGPCDDRTSTVPVGDHRRPEAHSLDVPGENVRPRRRKGQKSNWNPEAKMRARLIAESCIKQRCADCTASKDPSGAWSPPPQDCRCLVDGFVYRAGYDYQRAKWADRDTTDLHKHNHALGVVAKTVLRDLWREAKRIHEEAA